MGREGHINICLCPDVLSPKFVKHITQKQKVIVIHIIFQKLKSSKHVNLQTWGILIPTKFKAMTQLTYQQTTWKDVQCLAKMREFTLRHNVQRHLGQSEDWIFWISLVTHTCNVWRNKLSYHFVGHRVSIHALWLSIR